MLMCLIWQSDRHKHERISLYLRASFGFFALRFSYVNAQQKHQKIHTFCEIDQRERPATVACINRSYRACKSAIVLAPFDTGWMDRCCLTNKIILSFLFLHGFKVVGSYYSQPISERNDAWAMGVVIPNCSGNFSLRRRSRKIKRENEKQKAMTKKNPDKEAAN